MILIKKGEAPSELEALKNCAEKNGLFGKEAYNKLRGSLKADVRESLLREQGHICAYCMRELPDDRATENIPAQHIEHWIPLSRDCDSTVGGCSALDYNNMLAVCSGNDGNTPQACKHKKHRFTCDKSRGNDLLKVNPLHPETLSTIYYKSDGVIKAKDPEINDDIDKKLNLNCNYDGVTLPQNRKALLDAVQEAINSEPGDLRDKCTKQLRMWESEKDPKTPYIGIAIWWLKRQIECMPETCKDKKMTDDDRVEKNFD